MWSLKTRLPRFARKDKFPSLRGFEKAVAVCQPIFRGTHT